MHLYLGMQPPTAPSPGQHFRQLRIDMSRKRVNSSLNAGPHEQLLFHTSYDREDEDANATLRSAKTALDVKTSETKAGQGHPLENEAIKANCSTQYIECRVKALFRPSEPIGPLQTLENPDYEGILSKSNCAE
ncbi:unnamed protein product [Protopolystoma xenopodis]|uniref:Uncharacterized protein n=1 Tax=Protopolystoma xenopodis TaxID=117903 RepID=A0A448X3U7_9PLAT|nr:unnamed protein product [Protopolystoma xenopodis]